MFSLLSVFAYECIHKVEDVEGVLFGIVIWDSSSTDLTVFQSKIILDPTAGDQNFCRSENQAMFPFLSSHIH